MNSPAKWQLPSGVDQALWEYLNDRDIPREYDVRLAGTPLLSVDVALAEQIFPQPGALVDLGCGTGRLCIPFAAKGYQVTGVDLSAEMLAVAQEKAVAAGVSVELVQANLADLAVLPDTRFDYAACLFSTLGMLVGSAARAAALGHFRRILKPGGTLLLHAHNFWFSLWDRGGRIWLREQLWRWLRGMPIGDRRMPTPQGLSPITLHHFRLGELRAAVRRAGFHIRNLIPVSTRKDGVLPFSRLMPTWRAYGFFVIADLPRSE